jgi:AcrR family transcriptional regulator
MPRRKLDARLSQQDWLENALTVLSKKGRAGLSIQDLSAALGVSRGSFYWHFKDRKHFIHTLLEYWHEEYTAAVTVVVGRQKVSAEERLARILRVVHDQELTHHDLTMRTLAILDPQFSRSVRKADNFRLNFLRGLFEEMGFTEIEVQVRARACLAYMTMEHDIFDKLDRKHRSDLVDHLHAFLVRK